MSTNTIITVPDWARDYVKLYAERGRLASLGNGTEEQHPTVNTLITGTLVNGGNAYDSNGATYADIKSSGAVNGVVVFDQWTAAVKIYSALTINAVISWRGEGDDRTATATLLAEYSVDGGSTWHTLGNGNDAGSSVVFVGITWSISGKLYSIVLPSTTDLSLLKVRVTVGWTGSSGYCEAYIYEITTNGTYVLAEGMGSFTAYSGSIIAPQSQNEVDGIAALAVRGAGGDAVITKATAFLRDAINGVFLPGTESKFVAALALVTGNSTSSFASVSSRIGKKAMCVGDSDSTFLAQSLAAGYPTLFNARASAALYADNYAKERVLRDHALTYGVEMGKHPVINSEVLRQAGLSKRDYLQTTYVLTHKLFLEQQEINVAKLEIFGNILRALTGSQQSTTSTDPKANKMAAAVGMGIVGGMAGWYIGAEIGLEAGGTAGPYGAAIGFVVGAVVGYLSS